ncbi:hypothetical protein TVAG_016240 [Trichomonas vaginalis G3]|uniref:Uncharacterized protein n=1 Tax=Trichomonas vaginalis (strain ATCC PRA-98 / G3) TaxID=412133 RepID=A2DP94_TRIV3|nr:hypothetical protein TVAGG3_0910380 [Trichomonas vaginalis G3]EAY17794.1 hypothetical protein TVAG_016240 [Trichomonas vaginalis G3]KAI5484383.1 hypothetical protein TVAGG3_0910380 [Trichomonas vaginalis G3]|eukprot:XP_001329929.1 hypothetical protein [Trichomonas vaginalis G3]
MIFPYDGMVTEQVKFELQNSINAINELEKPAEESAKKIEDLFPKAKHLQEQYNSLKESNSDLHAIIDENNQKCQWLKRQIQSMNELRNAIDNSNNCMPQTSTDNVSPQLISEIKNQIEQICSNLENETQYFDENEYQEVLNQFYTLIQKADIEIDILSSISDKKHSQNTYESILDGEEQEINAELTKFSGNFNFNFGNSPTLTETELPIEETEASSIQDIRSQIISFINSLKHSGQFAESVYDDQISSFENLYKVLDNQKTSIKDLSKYEEYLLSRIRSMNSLGEIEPLHIKQHETEDNSDILSQLTINFKQFLDENKINLNTNLESMENQFLHSIESCVSGSVPKIQSLKRPVVDNSITKFNHSIQELIDKSGEYIPEAERLSAAESYKAIISEKQFDDFHQKRESKQNNKKFERPEFDTAFIEDFRLTVADKLPQSMVNFIERRNKVEEFNDNESDEDTNSSITDVEPLGEDPTLECAYRLNGILRAVNEFEDPVITTLDTSLLNISYENQPISIDPKNLIQKMEKATDLTTYKGMVAAEQAKIYSQKLKEMKVVDENDDPNEQEENQEIEKLTKELEFLTTEIGKNKELKANYLNNIKNLEETSKQLTQKSQDLAQKLQILSSQPVPDIESLKKEISDLEQSFEQEKDFQNTTHNLLLNKLNTLTNTN